MPSNDERSAEVTFWSTKLIEPPYNKTTFFDTEQGKDSGTNLRIAGIRPYNAYKIHRVEWDVVAHADNFGKHFAWDFLEHSVWTYAFLQTHIDGSPLSENCKETALGFSGSFTPLQPMGILAHTIMEIQVTTRFGATELEQLAYASQPAVRLRMMLRGYEALPWGGF